MPHLILEYTPNLSNFDSTAALGLLNQSLVETGEFNEADIKSRTIPLTQFLIGTETTKRAFIHLKLYILSGRSAALKKQLSIQLLATLSQIFNTHKNIETQLCVEVIDIDRDSYSKVVI